MAYQLYRNTTLGITLQESLDELIEYKMISPALAEKIRLQYDSSIKAALANGVKNRMTFKAKKLHTYRLCEQVWSFTLQDVDMEFPGTGVSLQTDRVRVVAVDANGSQTAGKAKSNKMIVE